MNETPNNDTGNKKPQHRRNKPEGTRVSRGNSRRRKPNKAMEMLLQKREQGKQKTKSYRGLKPTGKKQGGRPGGGFRGFRRPKNPTSFELDLRDSFVKQIEAIPPLEQGNIRIVPVCGVEGIGTNMTFIEMNDEIIVIDAGFGFKNPDLPGINYTLPNVAYLKHNKHKIKALVITHGHLDHVGGIPFVLEDLGNPPIYTREFGAMFIKKKLEEYPRIGQNAEIITINEKEGYTTISENLKVKFFGLTHSIPDSTGVIIQTPYGGIVSTGDVRVESENGVVHQSEIEQYKVFKDENILLCTMDSTGIPKPGWSISEDEVVDTIDDIMKDVQGRLFIAAFASQVERILRFIDSAKKYGKYVAFEGRSMKSNMAIAKALELTDFKHVVPISQIGDYPEDKMIILLTGGQGEQYSALRRISNETHKNIRLNRKDTIILSASVVPGNDYAVAQLKNDLYRGSFNVITYTDNHVHASGHGTREELKWIHTQIPYKFFMPVHGEPYMTRMHAKMAHIELGVPEENIVVPDNGSIIEIQENGTKLVKLEETIPNQQIVVDGTYLGPAHRVVMDDRKRLAEHGIFSIVVSVNVKQRKLRKSPDIISRGFVYLRESRDLLGKTRGLVRRLTEEYLKEEKHVDFDDLKKTISNKVAKFLLQKTHKEPIVNTVIVGS